LSNSIAATNLTCIRSEQTLFSELSLQVSSGECLHITGANGSGKSSLLRILCGLLTPDTGIIKWNNANIHKNPIYLNGLAYIGHKDALKNELTAAENLTFSYQSDHSLQNKSVLIDDQVDNHLARLNILHCADLIAQKLSFGQRRRLVFSKLLIKHYPIWVLDEPFTGIDHDGRQLIESLCKEHLEKSGIIILTNHQSLVSSPLAEHLQELSL